MTKLSMSDFRIPVIKALMDLAPVGDEVPYAHLWAKALPIVGLDPMKTATDDKAVTIPMNNALFDLKQRGCVTQSKRGVWAYTQAGADYANGGPLPASNYTPKAAGAAKPAKVVKPAKQSKAAPAPVVTAPAPVAEAEVTEPDPDPVPTETVEEVAERLAEAEEAPPAAKPAKRIKTARNLEVIADDAPAWVRDNYLRGMVAANTPCFGQYSPKAEACGGCALAGWCRGAQAAALSVLASKLTEAGRVSPATANLHTETATALSPNAPRATVTTPPRQIPVTYDGVCARTGSPLKAGSTGYYVPGEGVCALESLTAEERSAVTEGWGKP